MAAAVRAQRDEVTAPASEMMLDLAKLRAGSRVLDVAAGTGDQTLTASSTRRTDGTTYWPRTFLPAC